MALCAIFFMEVSARSLIVVIDLCSLVRGTLGETLDPGLPGRTMVVHDIILPHVGIIFGCWFWLEGSCGRAVCIFLVGDIECWRRGAAGTCCMTWLDGLAQGGGLVVLFGAMVAPMAGMTEFMRIFTLNIARWFDGGDVFCSVCMRYSLRVYYTR
jgi:hypothetical protein